MVASLPGKYQHENQQGTRCSGCKIKNIYSLVEEARSILPLNLLSKLEYYHPLGKTLLLPYF